MRRHGKEGGADILVADQDQWQRLGKIVMAEALVHGVSELLKMLIACLPGNAGAGRGYREPLIFDFDQKISERFEQRAPSCAER
jgi:hypothetical protein